MAKNENHDEEKRKIEELQEKRLEARLKMFVQMLDIKQDTNMTRIYSALKPIKNS